MHKRNREEKDALDDKIVWDAGKLRKTTKMDEEKMSTKMSIDLNVICNLLIKLFEANIICLTMNTFYEQLIHYN